MWENAYFSTKTQKLPGPLSGPWTPAADSSLRSRDSAPLRRQLSASEAGAPPLTKSWIRTWELTMIMPNFCPETPMEKYLALGLPVQSQVQY